jgi:hypothetical protein
MLDMAFGLSETSRLGCQVKLTKELDGMSASLPAATRNMFVDGAMHLSCHIYLSFVEQGRSPLATDRIYPNQYISTRWGQHFRRHALPATRPKTTLTATAPGTSGASDCPVLCVRLVLGDDRCPATPGGA